MSSLPPIADVSEQVSALPTRAKTGTHAPQQNLCLFDHPVGSCEQLVWHGKAQRLAVWRALVRVVRGRLLQEQIAPVLTKVSPQLLTLTITVVGVSFRGAD